MRKEFSALDKHVDLGLVHVHDAPSADIQMADFAVAHLSRGKPDGVSAGLHQRVRKVAQ